MHVRRAAVPVPGTEPDTPPSPLRLLPLLSLSLLVFVVLFFAARQFKRSFHLPSFTWLRGKGQGAKGRLGLSGVELLPTSIKSIPLQKQSPYAASFDLEGNAGKNGGTSLLSRSSSLDALPQFAVSSPSPPIGSPPLSSSRSPFILPDFMKSKRRSSHKRSKSLSVPHRQHAISATSSAPPTPSPQNLLIDLSLSSSSSHSFTSSTSASSDLGTHKLVPVLPPLIPGIPIPASSPPHRTTYKARTYPTTSNTWDFDDDADDGDNSKLTDPLLAAFKRPESHPIAPIPQIDSQTLIQYDSVASSTQAPLTPMLAPKRHSTANPFASFSYSPTHVAQQSPSPSPLSLSPSNPPGIELQPMKKVFTHILTPPTHPTARLVDYETEEPEAGQDGTFTASNETPLVVLEPPTMFGPLTPSLISVDPHITDDAHHVHVQSKIDVAEPVTDPFDDMHAVHSPLVDVWDFQPSFPPAVEDTEAVDAQGLQPERSIPESISPQPHLVSVPSSPVIPAILQTGAESLMVGWQWDNAWSPPSKPAPPNSTLVETDALSNIKVEIEDSFEAETYVEEKESSVLFERDITGEAEVENGMGGAVVDGHTTPLEIDVTSEMDPAETWFIEEPTAVWDASWTGEDVKGGLLSETEELEKDGDDQEFRYEREMQIRFLDGLLANSSEPIDIHILEEPAKTTILSDKPQIHDHLNDEKPQYINDINDNYDHTPSPCSVNATPAIIPATPLPSTPYTPPHALPSLALFPDDDSTDVDDEHPDPDLLPLPELPLSPLPLLSEILCPQPTKSLSPTTAHSVSQTPTPPASPPPANYVPARPLWSLRATDAPPLGLPATLVTDTIHDGTVPIPVANELMMVDAKDEVCDDLDDKAGTGEAAVVPGLESSQATPVAVVIDPPTGQGSEVALGESHPASTPKSTLSKSLPGSFPSTPFIPSVALLKPPPVHLSLLPRPVPKPSLASSSSAVKSSSTESAPTSTAVKRQNRVLPSGSNRLRTPRSAIDLALAMQLRPGLGAGADPAWMVRFLMALFGWVAVVVSQGEL